MNSLCIRQIISNVIHELYHIDDNEDWSVYKDIPIAWRVRFIDQPINIEVSEEEKHYLYWIPK